MEQQVLFWIFIAIFTSTAVITLLGITNVINIKNNFLNAMFTALILEVIAAVIVLFQGFDFNEKPSVDLNELITEANLTSQLGPRENPEAFIISRLKKSENLGTLDQALASAKQEADSLMRVIDTCQGKSGAIEEDLGKYKGSFLGKIQSLRELISKYGGFVNIAFKESEKDEVYKLLISIFTDLGMVANGTPIYIDEAKSKINYKTVQNIYRSLRKSYGISIDDENYVYINDSDTALMMRKYLSIIAPIEK